MAENNESWQRLSDLAKPIFLKWEKLRPLYNIIIGFVWLLGYFPQLGWDILNPFLVPIWLIGAILANICFFAAPGVETYLAWLGVRSKWVTVSLFLGGVLISIPCVLFFPGPFLF